MDNIQKSMEYWGRFALSIFFDIRSDNTDKYGQIYTKTFTRKHFWGWLLGSHCFFQCKYSYGRNKKIPLFQWTTIFVHIYVPIWYATNSIARIGSKIWVNIDKYRPALCFFISTSIFIDLLKIGSTPPNVCASGLCLHALACMCTYLLMHEYALSQDELPPIYILGDKPASLSLFGLYLK